MGSPGKPWQIPAPKDPGIPTRRNGYQGRLFRLALPAAIPNRPDVFVESNVAEIFVPDTDREYEPFPVVSYDLKGYLYNKTTNMKEPVIITVNCGLTFWPPTRPGVEVPADFVQRAIQSNSDPNSRIEMGSQVIDEYDVEIYPDKSRKPVRGGGVQTNFNRPLITNKPDVPLNQPVPTVANISNKKLTVPAKIQTKLPLAQPLKVPTKLPLKEPIKLQTKVTVKEPTKMTMKEPTKMTMKEPTKMTVKEPTKVAPKTQKQSTTVPAVDKPIKDTATPVTLVRYHHRHHHHSPHHSPHNSPRNSPHNSPHHSNHKGKMNGEKRKK